MVFSPKRRGVEEIYPEVLLSLGTRRRRSRRTYCFHLNEERYGHLKFLPVDKEAVKTQLFGFGWAALEAKNARIAFLH